MTTRELPPDLLDELDGREDRKELLRWLLGRGVGIDRLREAASEDTLALLPTELVLNRDCSYTLEQASELAGLDPDFCARVWRAAGIPVPDGPELVLDDEDLEALQMAKRVLDAGLSEDAFVEIHRVVGRSSAAIAQCLVEVAIEEFPDPDDDEAAAAMRLEQVADELTPLLPILLAFPVRMHLRDAVRNQALERGPGGVGSIAGTRRMAIAFADLVGFTPLSEQAPLDESSDVARRLEELATAVAVPPVRLVKLIGDSAMFVSEETTPLVEAVFRLRQRARAMTAFPELRIGLASGEVAPRAGDVCGPAVNLASRLADVAEPGQVLAGPELAEEVPSGIEVDEQPERDIKGVGELRPLELAGRPDGDAPERGR